MTRQPTVGAAKSAACGRGVQDKQPRLGAARENESNSSLCVSQTLLLKRP